MRRLPVYLLLDTSGSMTGEPLEAVKNGVQVMISSLRQNPQAIETAFISIITFDSVAKQIVPLTDLASFQMVDIRASLLSLRLIMIERRIIDHFLQLLFNRMGLRNNI